MATTERCDYYNDCAFVMYRKSRPDTNMAPLPENGNCGINSDECLRRRYQEANTEDRNRMNKICHVTDISSYRLPISANEIDVVYPKLPNNNGRDFRRIIGGAHR